MKIYLVGFMGAGKTTAGAGLAKRLAFPFLDLDELVEHSEGMTIKEIFAEKGEPYFRKRERDILFSTHYLEDAVIATGGGTFTFEENIQFIRGEGLAVYVAAPFVLLKSRISVRAAERPMFRDERAAHDLYQERLKYYKLSDITIEIRAEETPAEVVERILLELPKSVLSGEKRKPRR
ncbi:MAG TPA: shikimate kinase [Thermoanaerobaculia bacterium]|nr:shikimate kinase [Thermoanaerobaculia bacterium]